MAMLFGFGQSADVSIKLDEKEHSKTVKVRGDDGREECHHLFYDGENIQGTVHINLKKPNQKFEHQGIRIEFIGQIEVYYDRGNQHDFISMSRELASPGDLTKNADFEFSFKSVDKPFETYMGTNVKLRYFLRVTVVRRISDIIKEVDLVVHTLSRYNDVESSIKMEVGIEDCLHIEFEYNKNKYHLKDVIVGKIYFLLVRIKIKYMEIAILKVEIVGSGPNMFKESETVAKFEIMDGAPVRGETIPIRLFLAGYDLAPTMRDVGKKFSVKYFLNLVLIDEEDRRYFKQQEVTLWRQEDPQARRQPIDDGRNGQNVEGSEETQISGTQRFNSSREAEQPAEKVPPQVRTSSPETPESL